MLLCDCSDANISQIFIAKKRNKKVTTSLQTYFIQVQKSDFFPKAVGKSLLTTQQV